MSASSRETGAVDGEMVMSLKDRNEKEIYREEQWREEQYRKIESHLLLSLIHILGGVSRRD